MNNNGNSKSSYGRLIFSILAVVIFMLLFISLTRKSINGSEISFSSFLDWLGNINTFQFNVNIQDFYIYGDWGIFDFLRSFVNVFTSLFGVIVYLFSNLLNLLIYVSQFIVYLFS